MPKIYMKDLTGSDYAFGNDEGKKVFFKLQESLSSYPADRIFGISLKGIKATDASFPRESVVSIAKLYKGEKGFYICDVTSDDIIDNWSYAAQAKGQPLIVKFDNKYDIIGSDLTEKNRKLLDFVMSNRAVTTSIVSDEMDISVQNASAKLKKLSELGLLLCRKEAAETGGMEYVYSAIN